MMVIRKLHSAGSPPSSPSSAQASVLPSIPELGSSERTHLRLCSGEELPRRTAGRSCTGSELTRRPWPRPTTSASGRPRPPASPPHQRASSAASIGGASRPQPQPRRFVVGRHRRRHGEAPAATAGAHRGGRHLFFMLQLFYIGVAIMFLACCNWSHS
jgi:hypothetical protein